MRVWPLAFCLGCRGLLGIDDPIPLPTDSGIPDDAVDASDGRPATDGTPITDDIAHVGADDEYAGLGPLVVDSDWVLDTTALSSTPGLPPGVTLVTAAQDAGGPDLAILHVDTLAIEAGKTLRAIGDRPLVVIANSITIDGALDVGAIREQPGAGGSRMGPGAGGNGSRVIQADSGGGGGAFGGAGGRGGSATCVFDCAPDAIASGGQLGIAYDSGLGKLLGGSGGGVAQAPATPTACAAGIAGAGGGAVQLYARTAITISATGTIDAGGGGGRGGVACTSPANFLAGNGGGSGGAIFLQSATVTNSGTIAANGGAGGSGGGNGGDGVDGEDGRVATSPAMGGSAQGALSARGGNGGTGMQGAQNGSDSGDRGNGGGGGGGVGQLVVFYKTTWTAGTTSPQATTQDYEP